MTKAGQGRFLIVGLALVFCAYLCAAYLLLPAFWTLDDERHPPAPGAMVTLTADGLSGDPLNIVVDAPPETLVQAFREAGWDPADPVTFETSVEIVGSVLFDRPDPDAPVSPLFYEGRREDLAFEKPVGTSADRRQHIRLWRVAGQDGRTFVGAVTFDAGVSFSHYTGAVTHRISPDIDAARNALVADFEATGLVARVADVEAIGATQSGRNGEGDPYRTDGMASFIVLRL